MCAANRLGCGGCCWCGSSRGGALKSLRRVFLDNPDGVVLLRLSFPPSPRALRCAPTRSSIFLLLPICAHATRGVLLRAALRSHPLSVRCCNRPATCGALLRAPCARTPSLRRTGSLTEGARWFSRWLLYCYSYYARVVAPPPSPPAAAPPPTARCSRSRAVAVLVLQRRHTAVCMHTATATCDLWRACTLRRFAYRIADGRRWLGRWLLYCYTTQCHALVPVSHAQQVGGSRAVRRDAYRCELPLKRTN